MTALYTRYRQLIPTLVLATFCLNTVFTALGGEVLLDERHYCAFIVVIVAIAAFFYLRKYYKYILVVILGLGLLGAANFTASTIKAGVGIGYFTISISPVMLLYGILIYIINHGSVNAWLLKMIEPSEARRAEIQREEVTKFKELFSRKSSSELNHILTNNKLVPSAIMAVRALLKEREVE